jgi:hypothetical protein
MRGSGERRWETACESAGDSQGLNAPTFDSTFETTVPPGNGCRFPRYSPPGLEPVFYASTGHHPS